MSRLQDSSTPEELLRILYVMVFRSYKGLLVFLSGCIIGSLLVLSITLQSKKSTVRYEAHIEPKCPQVKPVVKYIKVMMNKSEEDTQNEAPNDTLVQEKIVYVSKEKVHAVDDPFDSVEKLDTRHHDYWEMVPHYNVDDYGVPVDEYLLSVENMKLKTPQQRLKIFRDRGIKTVLYYHAAYGSKTYGFNGREASKQGQLPYIMKGCKRRDCFCTDQRDFLPIDEFDAILFYSRTLHGLPSKRKSHQRYILWEVESASYLLGFNPKRFDNFFNWTHTYRRDSDFWEPWGMITQHKKFPKPVDELMKERKNDTTLAQTKQKAVAWFVSNCGAISGRDQYAKQLSQYVQVDIYGRCGSLKCERSADTKCWDMVEKDYYFYFSAENSRCKDYITEKFYNPLKKNIIPIVYGGAHGENDYYLAPKKSHINVDDFKSPEELGKFLQKLMNDKEEYVSYFWWKPYYSSWLGRWKKAHCEICDRLHHNEPVKIYKNMHDWWVVQGKCR